MKPYTFFSFLYISILCFFLSACGGGGGSDSGTTTTTAVTVGSSLSALEAPSTFGVSFQKTKQFKFTWSGAFGQTHYRLLENVDGSSGFSQLGSDIDTSLFTFTYVVPLHKRMNAQYILQSCNATTCVNSSTLSIADNLKDSIGYIKASVSKSSNEFGGAVSLSSDGQTLAVGAAEEDSNATGIGGNALNTSAAGTGAVYIYILSGGVWSFQEYIKASNAETDNFGASVSLSSDGNTLVVGAVNEDSSATGINGNEADNTFTASGAAYVFSRSGATWSQQAYIKASNAEAGDQFGSAVSLSSDGSTLVVAAQNEDSNATGINGLETDNSNALAGAVYIFVRSGVTWTQQAYIKASNANAGDNFGGSLSLSADGNTLAVAAEEEASASTGINGSQASNTDTGSGAVYVFVRAGVNWTQEAYIKASNANASDNFGSSVSLSGDSNTLAVGARGEGSTASGVNANQADNSGAAVGAVYVFTRSSATWVQESYIKASNSATSDEFGRSLALSFDGSNLIVSSLGEDGGSLGLQGDQTDNSVSSSGASYFFTRVTSVWAQESYIKSNNTEAFDNFGSAVSISSDGDTIAVGARFEDSGFNGVGATGISSELDNSFSGSGAIYLY